MLKKQPISVAIISVLCCAAVQVDAAKQAKGGGGGNHMQRGIQLAQEKHFDAAADEFGRRSKTIRKIRADMQIAALRIARPHELPWQRETPRVPLPGINRR